MKIYIIRHGETEWNRNRRLQGQTDVPLNENGRALARKVGEALEQLTFSRVISSPLQRAMETARLVLGKKNIRIETDERIREISFGSYEGLSIADPAVPFPDPEFHFFFEAPEKYHTPPGGENFAQLLLRTERFLQDLASRQEENDEQILVSTHGAASRALLANIEHTGFSNFWRGCVPPNCAVSIAELQDGKWKLLECDRLYYQER